MTDEEDVPDATGKLRAIYHHLMKLDYDNKRIRSNTEITADLDVEQKSPIQLFSDFYELQEKLKQHSGELPIIDVVALLELLLEHDHLPFDSFADTLNTLDKKLTESQQRQDEWKKGQSLLKEMKKRKNDLQKHMLLLETAANNLADIRKH